LKKRPVEKGKIDVKIRNFERECRKNGVDPRSMNEPMGDNCSGYPYLKNVPQGYDVDKKKP
jgi:hypothetical protein